LAALDAGGEVLEIGGQKIAPGTRATIDLRIVELSTHTTLTLPLQIVRARNARLCTATRSTASRSFAGFGGCRRCAA
jgi:hypothetical protein